MEEVLEELRSAMRGYGPMFSEHEGYAIIKEELEELWDLIKVKQVNRDHAHIRKEAIQLAAMALRFLHDLTERDSQ